MPAVSAAADLVLLPFKLLYHNLRRCHGSAWVTHRREPLLQRHEEGVRGDGDTWARVVVALLPQIDPALNYLLPGITAGAAWGEMQWESSSYRGVFSYETFESHRC